MKYLVCLLEEPSAREMLKEILPKILPDEIDVKYLVFEGKQDLGISGLTAKQSKKKYRMPDSLSNAAEELFKLTDKHYQKVAGSRAIAPYLKTDGSNLSHSFNVLVDGIKKRYCSL